MTHEKQSYGLDRNVSKRAVEASYTPYLAGTVQQLTLKPNTISNRIKQKTDSNGSVSYSLVYLVCLGGKHDALVLEVGAPSRPLALKLVRLLYGVPRKGNDIRFAREPAERTTGSGGGAVSLSVTITKCGV